MMPEIFLGGACGETTWRKQIAIPALDAAGITYFDPQLAAGAWTEADEARDMRAKAEAEVLLFVINGETRGIATIGEVAYSLGTGRRISIVLTDIPEGAQLDGKVVTPAERADLNRGRLLIRTIAAQHSVPVFRDISEAVQHAISLIKIASAPLTEEGVAVILSEVHFKDYRFVVEEVEDGFHIRLQHEETDINTGQQHTYFGRKWHVDRNITRGELVQTAFKAVVTWQEHE